MESSCAQIEVFGRLLHRDPVRNKASVLLGLTRTGKLSRAGPDYVGALGESLDWNPPSLVGGANRLHDNSMIKDKMLITIILPFQNKTYLLLKKQKNKSPSFGAPSVV